jgi:hypothetical protein
VSRLARVDATLAGRPAPRRMCASTFGRIVVTHNHVKERAPPCILAAYALQLLNCMYHRSLKNLPTGQHTSRHYVFSTLLYYPLTHTCIEPRIGRVVQAFSASIYPEIIGGA